RLAGDLPHDPPCLQLSHSRGDCRRGEPGCFRQCWSTWTPTGQFDGCPQSTAHLMGVLISGPATATWPVRPEWPIRPMNDAASRNSLLTFRIKSISWETEHIRSLELRAVDGRALPPFTAGAHIDLHLPNGMVRSYSLMNSQQERHRYLIGVLHANPSRGGSRCVHKELQPGDTVRISAPRNAFPLDEQASHSVLIAGGIGITPLISMAKRLTQL